MRAVRLASLRDMVSDRGALTVEDASSELGVSPETIRRDFAALARQGLVLRTRGGAAAPNRALTEHPIAERGLQHDEEKRAIARYAIDHLVEDGMALMLDGGTTAHAFAEMVAGRSVTVVTHAIANVVALSSSGTPVIVAGGQLRQRSQTTTGPMTAATLNQINADIALVTAPAVSAERGVMDSYLEGVESKRLMMANADQTYLLADSSKFTQTSFLRVCAIQELAGIVTDAALPPQVVEEYAERGVPVLRAGADDIDD